MTRTGSRWGKIRGYETFPHYERCQVTMNSVQWGRGVMNYARTCQHGPNNLGHGTFPTHQRFHQRDMYGHNSLHPVPTHQRSHCQQMYGHNSLHPVPHSLTPIFLLNVHQDTPSPTHPRSSLPQCTGIIHYTLSPLHTAHRHCKFPCVFFSPHSV